MINRRGLITGLISFVAAPAIVRYGSLMPVKAIVYPVRYLGGIDEYCNGIGRRIQENWLMSDGTYQVINHK